MALVLSLALLVLLGIAFEYAIPPRPSWADRIRRRQPTPPVDDPFGAAPLLPPDGGGILSRELVQQRLDRVAAELARLECDRSVFALAFRTYVARAAYTALLADASALNRTPALMLDRSDVGLVLDGEVGAGRPLREELEL